MITPDIDRRTALDMGSTDGVGRPRSAGSRVLVSWSSGKDSAWMLSQLLADDSVEVVGLLTTVNETHGRVAMHGVRRELVEAQAAAAGLPIELMPLSWPCPNGEYEARFADAAGRARAAGVTHIAFGDLHLEDIRDYRVGLLEGTRIEPMFPIWCGREGTRPLAAEMVGAGLRAVVTCVDPAQLDARFAGRTFDAAFLDELPDGTDHCAENGEFHTFCTHAPCFSRPVEVRVGESVERGGFQFTDVTPVTSSTRRSEEPER